MELDNRSTEPDDYELLKEPGESPVDGRAARPIGMWIAIVALIVAAAAAAYVVFHGRTESPSSAATAPTAPNSAPPTQALGGSPQPVEVPPLDDTDPLVRQLVNGMSAHPRMADWLATKGLIRNFALVTANIAEGATPARHLRPLRPSAPFAVVERGEGLVIDPASYHRYDAFAAAAASIDPAAAARVYATLKPRIQEAYGDVGDAGVPFDRVLERALIRLLQTPVAADPVRVRPHGAFAYEFEDPALEALSPAQKQLLRTGPANQRSIQRSLRAIALALGIPAERLPRS